MAEYTLTPTQSEQIQTTGDTQATGPATAIERGKCPWCDDYDGDHVGQHASSAHPEAWREYRDG
jgi:hypothetical protein